MKWDDMAERERDLLVAERVTKHFPFNDKPERFRSREHLLDIANYHVPDYTTDITAAWEVVEKMISKGVWFEIAWNPNKQRFRVLIGANGVDGIHGCDINARTAPEAICKAALLAVGEKID